MSASLCQPARSNRGVGRPPAWNRPRMEMNTGSKAEAKAKAKVKAKAKGVSKDDNARNEDNAITWSFFFKLWAQQWLKGVSDKSGETKDFIYNMFAWLFVSCFCSWQVKYDWVRSRRDMFYFPSEDDIVFIRQDTPATSPKGALRYYIKLDLAHRRLRWWPMGLTDTLCSRPHITITYSVEFSNGYHGLQRYELKVRSYLNGLNKRGVWFHLRASNNIFFISPTCCGFAMCQELRDLLPLQNNSDNNGNALNFHISVHPA